MISIMKIDIFSIFQGAWLLKYSFFSVDLALTMT